MIFISHTHKDKPIVDTIAQRLAAVFGQEKIFYDSWSIQPGDGLIDKMDEGLRNCKFFFFFVSKNSLDSKMVKLEWQNAIIKATKGEVRITPVKLDDCMMPDVLLQTLYIDIFGQGLENGIRQMIDVIQGRSTYQPGTQIYQNVRGYIKEDDRELTVEFRAETYLEPISRYLILVDNDEGDIEVKCKSDSMFSQGFHKDLQFGGIKTNGIFVEVARGTAPGFPFVVKLTQKTDKAIKLSGLMRAVKEGEFKMIPATKIG
ncbi:MAG TPA: toll/interleukin-1 receptor domain-containing protein [Dehalococcoidales bacterium]|nr:toll/interleukin-1 receptor domain-containing protein [Dehalococcoidales bacterium]